MCFQRVCAKWNTIVTPPELISFALNYQFALIHLRCCIMRYTFRSNRCYWSVVVYCYFRGGGYKANFLRSVIFTIFQNNENTGYLYDITFIFDRCHRSWAHRSWAAETPDKYERDWKDITYTLLNQSFPATEKINEWNVSNPHPGPSNPSTPLCNPLSEPPSPWMKTFEFLIKFHWNIFRWV